MQGAAGSPEVIEAFTVFHFAIIAVTALAVIAVLAVMIRLRARARADREAARTRGDDATEHAPPAVAAPTAPAPPPLADTPVPAAAPLDASPATVAASEPQAEERPHEEARQPEPAPAAVGAGDDLTRMKGVGPKLAAQLGGLGYTRFDQFAAMSPAEADTLDAQLGTFKGRLARDRWIEQAQFLASGDTAGFEQRFGKL